MTGLEEVDLYLSANAKRLAHLEITLLNNTVLSEWFLPLQKALDKVRFFTPKIFGAFGRAFY